MNFLAHLFLSGDDPELLVGNFIADHVKGNMKFNYPSGIRSGIELHRRIDHFTDTHSTTAASKQLLYPSQKKYAPVVVDLFYDHFLAAHFDDFSDVPLSMFTANAYSILKEHHDHLPNAVKSFLPYMIERDWLYNYASVEGIDRSLKGLSKRVRFDNRMDSAATDLVLHYEALKMHFKTFFPDLMTYVAARPHEAICED